MICEEVRKPESEYEAACTLLGSERRLGQVHLLQIFGLEGPEVSEGNNRDDEERAKR